jgi:predicted RNase H-like nuclease (RuvC/YqgF family)
MGGSWRDLLEWLKPGYVREREKLVEDLMESNEALHKDVDRLRQKTWRLNAALEKAREQSLAREEAQSQRITLLLSQARRCKCRS